MGMLAETSTFFSSIYEHYNTNDKNKSFSRKMRINMLRCTIESTQTHRMYHGAVLRILANTIYYRLQRRVTSDDYVDFLRRARWKAYQKARRQDKVGDYLCIL